MNVSQTNELAKKVRRDIVDLTYQAGNNGTHIGGSLSIVELLSVLYNDIMNIDKENLADEYRDRFIMSKGHGAMAQYAVMHRTGLLSEEDIKTFRKDGSAFSTHPCMNVKKGIEFSSGSLGHGLSLGVGSALALKKKGNLKSKVFVMMGDGECDEGSVWEAAMSATNFKLDNLVVIIDKNRLQVDGFVEDVMKQESLEEKWKSFGWDVYSTDGHNVESIYNTFTAALKNQTQATVVFANTIKGKGVSFIENRNNWHIGVLNEESYKQAVEELERQ